MKNIICFSGGHSSALVALEVAEKFGTKDLILLNHDININAEKEDIKRFKNEVSSFLNLPITYANHPDTYIKDQFDICIEEGAFAPKSANHSNPICSNRLKTEPFYKYLAENFPAPGGLFSESDCVIYYGFDAFEKDRILRRENLLGQMGYQVDFPLGTWFEEELNIFNDITIKNADNTKRKPKFLDKRKYNSTLEIGINPPNTYSLFNHANCVGCLRAGLQHWYVVYCNFYSIFQKAKYAELKIGYSILKQGFLRNLEAGFELMKKAEIPATEKIDSGKFWALVRKTVGKEEFKKIRDSEKQMLSCGSVECTG